MTRFELNKIVQFESFSNDGFADKYIQLFKNASNGEYSSKKYIYFRKDIENNSFLKLYDQLPKGVIEKNDKGKFVLKRKTNELCLIVLLDAYYSLMNIFKKIDEIEKITPDQFDTLLSLILNLEMITIQYDGFCREFLIKTLGKVIPNDVVSRERKKLIVPTKQLYMVSSRYIREIIETFKKNTTVDVEGFVLNLDFFVRSINKWMDLIVTTFSMVKNWKKIQNLEVTSDLHSIEDDVDKIIGDDVDDDKIIVDDENHHIPKRMEDFSMEIKPTNNSQDDIFNPFLKKPSSSELSTSFGDMSQPNTPGKDFEEPRILIPKITPIITTPTTVVEKKMKIIIDNAYDRFKKNHATYAEYSSIYSGSGYEKTALLIFSINVFMNGINGNDDDIKFHDLQIIRYTLQFDQLSPILLSKENLMKFSFYQYYLNFMNLYFKINHAYDNKLTDGDILQYYENIRAFVKDSYLRNMLNELNFQDEFFSITKMDECLKEFEYPRATTHKEIGKEFIFNASKLMQLLEYVLSVIVLRVFFEAIHYTPNEKKSEADENTMNFGKLVCDTLQITSQYDSFIKFTKKFPPKIIIPNPSPQPPIIDPPIIILPIPSTTVPIRTINRKKQKTSDETLETLLKDALISEKFIMQLLQIVKKFNCEKEFQTYLKQNLNNFQQSKDDDSTLMNLLDTFFKKFK
jgi:hypothetical protein